ncbi:MAG TPA: hypothetical protein VKU80_07765 [Planctomycetota bacterium]|nr:hypothetical protein [Planctomycetota bacterium]
MILGAIIAIPMLLVLGMLILIDPLVKGGIETGGSTALRVPVHLKSAFILFSGKASLTGFEIANPPGFAESRSVAFERVDTAVQPTSLLRDTIDVGDLIIVKPELTLEFTGTKSNWSALLDNLSTGKPANDPKAPAGPGKKFIIRRMRIEEVRARFRSDLIPGGATSVTLPSIELENVGTAEGGKSLGQVLQVILHSLGNSALKAGQGIVPAELLQVRARHAWAAHGCDRSLLAHEPRK